MDESLSLGTQRSVRCPYYNSRCPYLSGFLTKLSVISGCPYEADVRKAGLHCAFIAKYSPEPDDQ